ncbi:MAG TPA: flagellar biosynthesis protein FlhF, partial [Leptospiraceae bacterium]|nr:flagellar biosynthesis protein FlhF [Leptospiraceae bacterium]
MDFVKIRGKDIQDCFMQMKMKYGPEAHVYEQRIVTEGGIFGTGFLAKKYVEIEIGVPEQQSSKEKVEKKLQDLKELLKQKSEEEGPKKKTLTNMKPLLQREKEKENSKQTVKDDYISDDFLDNDDEEEDYIPPSNLGLSIKDELTKKESVSASA